MYLMGVNADIGGSRENERSVGLVAGLTWELNVGPKAENNLGSREVTRFALLMSAPRFDSPVNTD